MKETDIEFRIAVQQIIGADRTLWDFGAGLFTVPLPDPNGLGYLSELACFIVDKKACTVLGVKIVPPQASTRKHSIDWPGAILEALKRAAPLFDKKAVPWKPGDLLPTKDLV